MVAFGLGGIYTEILHDFSLRIAPFEKETALEMIREIHAFPLLDRARGQAPCDLDALADLLAKFSQLPASYPEIDEIDLNPVFALPKRGAGRGCPRDPIECSLTKIDPFSSTSKV